jgi:glycosyltransferase involved in cell wall biosynthesis
MLTAQKTDKSREMAVTEPAGRTAGVLAPRQDRPARSTAGMIIGLDNISPGLSTGNACIGGMRTYLQDLATHLPHALPGAMIKLFTPSWSPSFDLPANESVQVVDCGKVPTSRSGRVWFEQAVLPRFIRDEKLDVWLGTCNTLPLRIPCSAALIVQSLQFFTHPEAFPPVRRWYLQTLVPASIRRAETVIMLSESSRGEAVRRFRTPDHKIRVIPHCLHDVFASSEPDHGDREVVERVLGETAPYVLYVSALYPYKNHARLIEAFARIHARFPRHRLLIGGSDTQSWGRKQLAEIAEGFGVRSKVVLTGRLAQNDLPALYRCAQLLAMPSLDETFGLPVLEAMAFGCPVLTSNISSMAEVAGDAAVLVDPFSVDEMARALVSVLGSKDLRMSLSARGIRQSALFSREKMMEKFRDALVSLPAARKA